MSSQSLLLILPADKITNINIYNKPKIIDYINNKLIPFSRDINKYPNNAQFKDIYLNLVSKYENESVEMIMAPDGNMYYPNSKKIKRKYKEDQISKMLKIYIKFSDLFNTVEDFIEDWCDVKLNEKYKKYGHLYNPNGKYDEYNIGGRYHGKLLAKQNCNRNTLLYGTPGKNGYYKDSYKSDSISVPCDGCLKKDLDVEKVEERPFASEHTKENLVFYKYKPTNTYVSADTIRDILIKKEFPFIPDLILDKDDICYEINNNNKFVWDIYNKLDDNDYLVIVDCYTIR
jgi:hypothetical protein